MIDNTRKEADTLRALPRDKISSDVKQLLEDNEKANATKRAIEAQIARLDAHRAELEAQLSYQTGVSDYTMGLALVRHRAHGIADGSGGGAIVPSARGDVG